MKKRTLSFFGLSCLFVAGLSAQTTTSSTQQKSIDAYEDLLRKDLRTQKQAVVDQAMGLDAAGKAKFWGIYDKYQKELTALWDQRLANIDTYAENYDKMTDAMADQLATSALNNQQQDIALLRKYYGLYKTAMGAKVAARFLQIEVAFSSLGNLQILAHIPLIQ